MKLIVGLGNPGEKYAKTRHNAGWIVLDWFAENCSCGPLARLNSEMGPATAWARHASQLQSGCWSENKRLKSSICCLSDTILAKPLTFMNSSGEAIKKLINYYKIPFGDLLVVHDDLDLPLGEYRLQKGRGAAGHKGVQSVIDCMDSQDFWRLRIGIGQPSPICHPEFISGSERSGSEKMLNPSSAKASAGRQVQHDEASEVEYVLQNFSKEELKALEDLFKKKLLSEFHNFLK